MNKINLLISDAFIFPGGGQEGVVIQLLKILDRKKFNIFFATRDGAKLPLDLPPDIPVYNIGLKSKYDFYSVVKIRKLVKRYKIDVINMHGFRASLLIRLSFLFTIRRPRLIYTAQVNYDQLISFSRSLLKRFSKIIGNILDYLLTDKIIFVSNKNMTNRIMQIPVLQPDKSVVIYNGVCISTNRVNTDQLKEKNKKIIIACLSALVKRKGINILIEAVHLLNLKGINGFEIKVGGEGIERKNLQNMINKRDLKNRFILMGYVEKTSLLKQADIFVLPTFSEGFPLSILEAGNFNLPVIASRVDGIPEVIQDGENGFLVQPGDAEELAEKLERLLNDSELRHNFGMSLSETVKKKFDEDKMVEAYSNIFVNFCN